MSHGFKGTTLGISSIKVAGSQVHVEVQFQDDEGVVHAVTQHNIPIGENEVIRRPMEDLMVALRTYIMKLHFDVPEEQKEVRLGIAESLRRNSTDHPEGFEDEG